MSTVALLISMGFGFVAGVIISAIVALLVMEKWYAGCLREDRSDPDGGPYYFLEISPGRADKLGVNRKILLNVKRENYIK